jgi:hypothetical protein
MTGGMMSDPLHERIRRLRGDGVSSKKRRTGKVTGIREHYRDPSIAQLDLQDEDMGGAETVGGRRGATKLSSAATAAPTSKYDTQFSVEVPKKHVKGLRLGDRVHVHTMIEKA